MNTSRNSQRRVQSLTRRLPTVPAPLALFDALTNGGRQPNSVLLESAEATSRKTQRSMLVVSGALEIVCRGPVVQIATLNSNGQSLLPLLRTELARFAPKDTEDGIEVRIERANPNSSEDQRLHADSPLSVLRMIHRALEPESSSIPESVLLVGLFAYDLVAQFETLPEPVRDRFNPADDVPDFRFLLADKVVLIDHLRQHAEVIVNAFAGSNFDFNYHSSVDAIAQIAGIAETISRDAPGEVVFPELDSDLLPNVQVDASDAEFASVVESMQRHITAGDVFQIVPSRSFSVPCADALVSYASLRQLNPSPYLFFFNFGDFILFGASPESAVKVDGKQRQLEISPIAGTRRRGIRTDGSLDADWDGRIEAELRLDEKENAEHMMLVDLARNDVARVSKPGTRNVTDLARIDRYSHVMHLVSRVKGTLRDELDALHAYQASMNMGTLTGAPKIKAMELIRHHERTRRGHYGGAVGYWRGDGSLDTAIVIRAALVRNGVAHVRAGAGVVHDSIPQLEAEETRRKAEAVLRSIIRANALLKGGSDRG